MLPTFEQRWRRLGSSSQSIRIFRLSMLLFMEFASRKPLQGVLFALEDANAIP